MKKIKSFLFSEKKLSGAIFGVLILVAFAFIFGPNIYAQFSRTDGGTTGYGYGYGYGYGSGTNDGSYRIGGGSDADVYEYGYGFADTYTWHSGSYGSCSVTSCGSTGTETRTVTCQNSASTVVADTYCDAGSKPATSTSCSTDACSSGGGGGGSYTAPTCTSVVYGDYTAACFAGYQYRTITSRTPVDCAMTVAQQDAAKKLCGAGVPNVDINGDGLINYQDANNSANFIALEKNLVKKINKALAKRLSGRILLQVQEHGEAWYVNPMDLLKYYMGRPADAFAMMRKFGLGVSEKDYNNFVKNGVPARLDGRILLRVQAHGEAYYISPTDGKMSYMGRPADAFALMRKFGLGITNADLRQIGVGELK